MNNSNFKTSTKEDLKEMIEARKAYAEYQRKTGHTEIQANRYFNDKQTAHIICGDNHCPEMNENTHGWDSYLTRWGVYNENKNVGASEKCDILKPSLQDMSDEKIEAFKNGVILSIGIWYTDKLLYMLIGNSKYVGKQIEDNCKGKRNNSEVSFIDMMINGFKIVAIDSSKEEVLKRVKKAQKTMARNLTIDEIYDQSDIENIMNSLVSGDFTVNPMWQITKDTTKSGIKKGTILKDTDKYKKQYADAIKLLSETNFSIEKIKKFTGVSYNTLHKLIDMFNIVRQ